MSNPSDSRSKTPYDHVLVLMANSLELAVGQQLGRARDVLRAAKIMADGLGFKPQYVFVQLDDDIITKPSAVLRAEFSKAMDEVRKQS